MGKRDLKKELAEYDKKMLIGLISELYDKNKSVREYLDYYLAPNEKTSFETFKIKVREAFYPKRGFGFKLAVGKKVISDFRKLNPTKESLIDLMLYYVECGVEFTNDYGDINENYYLSLERTFRDALSLVDKHLLHDTFKDRALNILGESENIGWGFHDTLVSFYFETFAVDEE
jgi:hypothetical protein